MKTKKRTGKRLEMNVTVSTPLSRRSITARDHRDLSTWEIQNRISGLHERRQEAEQFISESSNAITARKKALAVINDDIAALEALVESRR